jgi:hypothetical protein
MADDSERDEAITEGRISGTSTRALAKLHGCSGREIEEAIDRRLSYELDNRQRLRAVKVSAARCEQLMTVFLEKAMKGDAQAGLLCIKIEERLALLLGLDAPTTQHVDVYAVERAQQPTQFDRIHDAIMRIARPERYQYNPDGDGNGGPDASEPTEGNGSSGPLDPTR